jgi:hypothetical protein
MATPATRRGTIRGMDDIPDFGDLDGLARLARQAIEAIEGMDLPHHEREAWIAEMRRTGRRGLV